MYLEISIRGKNINFGTITHVLHSSGAFGWEEDKKRRPSTKWRLCENYEYDLPGKVVEMRPMQIRDQVLFVPDDEYGHVFDVTTLGYLIPDDAYVLKGLQI